MFAFLWVEGGEGEEWSCHRLEVDLLGQDPNFGVSRALLIILSK